MCPDYMPDFSEVVEFKPLDPGSYNAVVESYEEKSSKKDGSPYLQWTLVIADEAYRGSKVWMNTMLSGRGAGILKHFLKTCDGSYEGGRFNPDNYLGSEIGVVLENREYNGKTSIAVKDVFSTRPRAEEDIPF